MRARFLQDLKQAGVTKVGYVPTADNAADLLTKPLERSKFVKHRAYLMGDADPVRESDLDSDRASAGSASVDAPESML